jgi:hypothetical protein
MNEGAGRSKMSYFYRGLPINGGYSLRLPSGRRPTRCYRLAVGKGVAALSVAAALVVGLVLLLPACARGALYWPTSYGLARANADGSEYKSQFISPDLAGGEYHGCEDVVVDTSHVYWSDPARDAIARAKLDGSGVEYDFLTGLANPCGMAVDATSIYWTEERGEAIARANLDGGELNRGFIVGIPKPCGVAVGGGYIFWTSGNGLTRMPLSGGVPQRIHEGSLGDAFCGVDVDAAHVYWGGFGESIGRADLDGSHPEPSFITGIDRPCGIAVQGSRIYWTRDDVPGAVQGADLEGRHVAETIIDNIGGGICGIAADSITLTPPPPTPPGPSHVISFWHSRHGGHRPATFIRIRFPQAGSFTVRTGPAVKWRVLSNTAAALTLSGPEERLLKIWPSTGNRSATALRAKLRRTGRAQAVVNVHFLAQDGTASTKRKWLLLVDRDRRR